jgi:hypothetical protein
MSDDKKIIELDGEKYEVGDCSCYLYDTHTLEYRDGWTRLMIRPVPKPPAERWAIVSSNPDHYNSFPTKLEAEAEVVVYSKWFPENTYRVALMREVREESK